MLWLSNVNSRNLGNDIYYRYNVCILFSKLKCVKKGKSLEYVEFIPDKGRIPG